MSCIGQDKSGVPLSIILTVYNGEQYLNAAIQSILHQTIEEYDLLVIDDGSTDGTKSLLESINDRRVKPFFLTHTGRAHAVNEGVKHAQAPLIAFMDADDIALPRRLEWQLAFLKDHPYIGAVSGWYQTIDESGKTKKKLYRLPTSHTEIEWEMTKHCSLCFPALMIRKEVLDRVGTFDEGLQSALDYDYFLRLLSVTQVANIPELLLYHRRHCTAISTVFRRDQQKNKRELAERYLLTRLQHVSTIAERNSINFRLGVNEYYYGSMQTARQWFYKISVRFWTIKLLCRYVLPSFLGNSFFKMYRFIRNEY